MCGSVRTYICTCVHLCAHVHLYTYMTHVHYTYMTHLSTGAPRQQELLLARSGCRPASGRATLGLCLYKLRYSICKKGNIKTLFSKT